ncbi:major facilitator superfamily domain-containing protein [Desarmillaria ectypa]|nr:major facilitator superfamily domain-containing protein [Desarmillaria ectypa]
MISRKWSPAKRAFRISFLTFTVYIGSAIYTPSIPGLMTDFNVFQTTATLGLTLYVLAYGIAPMFLAPLQKLPGIGRTPVYMVTLFLFVIFQIPIVMAKSMSTVLTFRFLTGFVSSPALATGGVSMADIYPTNHIMYVLGIWSLGAFASPILGPVIGGFALIFLLLFLPETYGPTILLKWVRRLRKLTGNGRLRSQSEKDSESETFAAVMKEALIHLFILAKEPVLMFANLYVGFVYAIFYLCGLPFLGFIVSAVITYTVYVIYLKYRIAPRLEEAHAAGIDVLPEIHLEIGLMASIFIPTSDLIFGFTAKESTHWIRPCHRGRPLPSRHLPHLPGHPDICDMFASVFPLFGCAFFVSLGMGPRSALLASKDGPCIYYNGCMIILCHHKELYGEFSFVEN